MIIVSLCEILSVPGAQGDLAWQDLDKGLQALKASFEALWSQGDVDGALAPVPDFLAAASNFNSGARLEPRYWKCKWKADFLDQCVAVATKLRLDILTIQSGMAGSGKGQKGDTAFGTLKKVPGIEHMEEDLVKTLEDAREIAIELLAHGYGPFS